ALAASGGTTITAQLPLPHFRLRQVTTSATVWDAQTIVLGGLISDNVLKIKDKVPVLGDVPFLGRLFRSESMTKTKKNLIIFVTPTNINPDGSRYHSDDEMPFNQSLFPPQRPITQQ
ncbi:MAG TPA: type II and III secretion system protein, partial [Verrucomicrobiae bacterium]|nr:type II and III secretion system protein [Verrucomicrobiae bacterium]